MMYSLSRLSRVALWVAVLSVAMGLVPTARAAAVGATDVDITIPDIGILHYFSEVDVTITNAALGTLLTGTAGDSIIDEIPHAAAVGGFGPDLAISPSALTGGDPSAVVLTLQNASAVRAISSLGQTNTTLTIANTDATLDHATTTATITITGAEVAVGATQGTSIAFAAPGLVTPTTGDVELTLDLTNAINAGEYQDGVYTLTASNP